MALVSPHGSEKVLTSVMLTGKELEDEKKRAESLPKLQVSDREAGDLLMMGMGAFSPLTGFMGRDDYEGCLDEMKLRKSDPGVLWPLPVTFAVDKLTFKEGEVALCHGDSLLAVMTVEEVYEPNKERECECSFMGQGSYNRDEFWMVARDEHPGVREVLGSGKYYVGGPVRTLYEGTFAEDYENAYRPEDARRLFEERGWSTVAAFQTRNPMHRSQEYICKLAQEFLDGLFIHAVVGATHPGEVPAEIRMQCYTTLIENYFDADRTLLGVYPMFMRYAGPREALLHAIIRQNFGCSHLLVGRDHAGIGDFYGLFEAQAIFDTLWEGALELQPLKVDWAFWSIKNNGMASLKTCPTDDPDDRILVSGTKLRKMLAQGKAEEVPSEFSRIEVLKILQDYYL
ncbi:MAG: sulfate adenylyltransferase [Desulfobulbaceae bacterium]|nr:sulfate adenylyltransferase [Desulfobulbaceae bacterium]MCK5404168.1 sulfate adenylyltransferase [Desulfobulbaceae bacterium]